MRGLRVEVEIRNLPSDFNYPFIVVLFYEGSLYWHSFSNSYDEAKAIARNIKGLVLINKEKG